MGFIADQMLQKKDMATEIIQNKTDREKIKAGKNEQSLNEL